MDQDTLGDLLEAVNANYVLSPQDRVWLRRELETVLDNHLNTKEEK